MEVTEFDSDDAMTLDDADRKAWRGVDNMRKSLRNLHELTANLVEEEKVTIKKTETAAAIYEEQLIETKENIVNITKELSRAATQRKGLLRSQTSMDASSKVDENKVVLVNKVHVTVGTVLLLLLLLFERIPLLGIHVRHVHSWGHLLFQSNFICEACVQCLSLVSTCSRCQHMNSTSPFSFFLTPS